MNVAINTGPPKELVLNRYYSHTHTQTQLFLKLTTSTGGDIRQWRKDLIRISGHMNFSFDTAANDYINLGHITSSFHVSISTAVK